MAHANFGWVYKKFIKRVNPLIFQVRAGISHKTVYSWAQDADNPYYRRDPLSKAVDILDILKDETPELFQQVLQELLRRYGYVPVKQDNPSAEDVKLSRLMKELNDVPLTEVNIMEDGRITKEELLQLLNEIDEALAILNEKRAIVRQKVLSLKEEY
ncbi:MAG TPA: hypothetical protein DEP48_03000 [Persephonella sp.]|uniref:Uncharacterized protein n=1 Tax=Persephonella marina (strain DSM 14350 / EX-H1) TaxID=123214 RepID=C0QSB4_PERMH|nr:MULTISPECIES: hypothetical protein [Persephonella]ACO04824.1 hypothetical protein PERMA_1797 [Persephonella marina EX-H1]HCB69306.1 hypothetical protein [Persephonella sp.]